MFSLTLKRSAATLGVVAGLLAAAAPASAMPIYMKVDADGGAVVSRPDQTAQTLHHEGATVLNTFGGNDTLRANGITCLDQDLVTVKGPTNSQADSLENTMVSGYNVKADAEGTQVGSEGAKAPVVVLTGSNDSGWTEGNDQPCDWEWEIE